MATPAHATPDAGCFRGRDNRTDRFEPRRNAVAINLRRSLGGSRLRLLRCRRTNMRLVYSVVKRDLLPIVSRSCV